MDNIGNGVGTDLAVCCRETVARQGHNNPMMTCGCCHKIVKRFGDIVAFRNYKRFCLSRRRSFVEGMTAGYYVVAFVRPT